MKMYQLWRGRVAAFLAAALMAVNMPMFSLAVETTETTQIEVATNSNVTKPETSYKDKEVNRASDSNAHEAVCICTEMCDDDHTNEECPLCNEDYTVCKQVQDGYILNDTIAYPICISKIESNKLLERLLAGNAYLQELMEQETFDSDEFTAAELDNTALWAHVDVCEICQSQLKEDGAYFQKFYGVQTLQTLPVPYEEVELDGREFSLIASVGEAPYYQVFKFHTPISGGGSYTFYTEYIDIIDSVGFLCSEDQYVNLCDAIETAQSGGAYSAYQSQGLCIITNDDGGSGYNFYVNYNLEEDTDYYFVGARYSKRYNGEYKLIFMKDIAVDLDNQSADTQGTETIYSKGNLWYLDEGRINTVSRITIPVKAGFVFGGYYTEENGGGEQVIDPAGTILPAMNQISLNATVYGAWLVQPEIATISLPNGYVGTTYSQKLALTNVTPVTWTVESGNLPEGINLHEATGVISGIASTPGTFDFTVKATNQSGEDTQILSILINDKATGSNADSDDSNTTPHWSVSNEDWNYTKSDGIRARNEWLLLNYDGQTRWYHFGADMKMNTGWLLDSTGAWHYLNPNSDGQKGAMVTGWLTDLMDGNRYYLDPATGKMIVGWVTIDGVEYYFNDAINNDSGWQRDMVNGEWIYTPKGVIPHGALVMGKQK